VLLASELEVKGELNLARTDSLNRLAESRYRRQPCAKDRFDLEDVDSVQQDSIKKTDFLFQCFLP
jgi:hypothetical protein